SASRHNLSHSLIIHGERLICVSPPFDVIYQRKFILMEKGTCLLLLAALSTRLCVEASSPKFTSPPSQQHHALLRGDPFHLPSASQQTGMPSRAKSPPPALNGTVLSSRKDARSRLRAFTDDGR